MSIRKWQEIAKQKEVVQEQRKNILNAFKERKIQDEIGLIGAEKLFRPVTRRMGENQIQQLPAPDYDVDDEIRNWDELPFIEDEDEDEDEGEEEGPDYSLLEEDYKKDEILPVEKQTPRQPQTPLPPQTPRPLSPRPLPRTQKPSSDYPKFPRDPDSVILGILNRCINSNRHNPKATISSSESKFQNWSVERAKAKVEKINEKRRNSVRASREKKVPFNHFAGLNHRERRDYIGMKEKRIADIKQLSQFKDMDELTLKETFGTGFISNWINRLSLGIASINAENTSIKLKKEIQQIADRLLDAKVISQEQRKKILSLK